MAETSPYITEIYLTTEQYFTIVEYLNLIGGIMVFFVVVLLCYFGYKFLRIFI